MPGESGLELCADIAGNRPDLPVILMTAFGDTRAVSLGLRAGASDFLAKPFSLSDLGDAVGRALGAPSAQRTRVNRWRTRRSGPSLPVPVSLARATPCARHRSRAAVGQQSSARAHHGRNGHRKGALRARHSRVE